WWMDTARAAPVDREGQAGPAVAAAKAATDRPTRTIGAAPTRPTALRDEPAARGRPAVRRRPGRAPAWSPPLPGTSVACRYRRGWARCSSGCSAGPGQLSHDRG